MAFTADTLRLLDSDGSLIRDDRTSEYLPLIEALSDQRLRDFHRQMVVMRRVDRLALEAMMIAGHGEE